MTKTLDLTKPVQTIAGSPVEIISTKGRKSTTPGSLFPIMGYIDDGNALHWWDVNGRHFVPMWTQLNLVNVPVKRIGWGNMSVPDGHLAGRVHATEEQASKDAHRYPSGYWRTVRIEWEE